MTRPKPKPVAAPKPAPVVTPPPAPVYTAPVYTAPAPAPAPTPAPAYVPPVHVPTVNHAAARAAARRAAAAKLAAERRAAAAAAVRDVATLHLDHLLAREGAVAASFSGPPLAHRVFATVRRSPWYRAPLLWALVAGGLVAVALAAGYRYLVRRRRLSVQAFGYAYARRPVLEFRSTLAFVGIALLVNVGIVWLLASRQ